MVAAIGLLVLVFTLRSGDHKPNLASRPTISSPDPSPSPLRQARWRVHAFPSAITARVTKKDRKTARSEGTRASRGIEDVYDAVFLEPSVAERAVRQHFEGGAARAFLRSKTGSPAQLRRVQITYRSIYVGVEAQTSQRAIATVTVLAKGLRSSRRVKIKHESTLWLERVHRVWKVLAFRAHQRPQ